MVPMDEMDAVEREVFVMRPRGTAVCVDVVDRDVEDDEVDGAGDVVRKFPLDSDADDAKDVDEEDCRESKCCLYWTASDSRIRCSYIS